jgi:uncharacterized membrane protein
MNDPAPESAGATKAGPALNGVPMTEQDAAGGHHPLETAVGYILQIGVLLSVTLLGIGLIWRRLATGHFSFDYSIQNMNLFEFVADDLRRTLAGAFRPRLFVSLGIAVLMLTPYVRVLASMILFAAVERNAKYALFTAFVLAVLTYTLFLR